MKTKLKILILMSLGYLLSISRVSAQITISKNNMPVAGQNIIYSTSNDSIDITKTGADTTWDYSYITPVSQDTYKYVTPKTAGSVYSLLFYGDVGLNISFGGQKGGYEFYKTSATQYTTVGVGISIAAVPIPLSISYSPADVIYRFPVKFGNRDTSTFEGSTTISNFTVKIQGKRFNVVDGWGTIITPYKTYNCIRVRSIVKEIDSIFGTAVDNSRVEYKWLSTKEQIPVFEAVVTNGIQGLGGGMTITYRDSYKNIINPNGPVVDFNVVDTNVLTRDSVLFNNTTTGGLRYTWVIKPTTFTFAGGTNNTSKNPYVIFNAPGLYTVSLNAIGLGGSNYLTKTDYINVTHNATIEENAISLSALKLFPNPTSGEIMIQADRISKNKSLNISVFNTTGKVVYASALKQVNGYIQLNLSSLSKGLYLIRIYSDSQLFEGRVIKE